MDLTQQGDLKLSILCCLNDVMKYWKSLSRKLCFALFIGISAHPVMATEITAGSPYLQQHASDLVKWHQWGDEAFEKARKLNRPIYLSIGYSACHWCHVMQEESFTNPAIAKILNENYVPILVDRERRPDIDESYMMATEAMSGQGGWPNNLILTPEKEPVFGAVYIPPNDLKNLLNGFLGDWAGNEPQIRAEAKRVSGLLASFLTRKLEAAELTPEIIKEIATFEILK